MKNFKPKIDVTRLRAFLASAEDSRLSLLRCRDQWNDARSGLQDHENMKRNTAQGYGGVERLPPQSETEKAFSQAPAKRLAEIVARTRANLDAAEAKHALASQIAQRCRDYASASGQMPNDLGPNAVGQLAPVRIEG
jgi:hypothetical protein